MEQNACPHCDASSFALRYPLLESGNFRVVADVHPLTEGHILIIPKEHISCAGAFPPRIFSEFTGLYGTFTGFIRDAYGRVSTFEHGVAGQTVSHAHIHILPFSGNKEEVVGESGKSITAIAGLEELPRVFKRQGKYLHMCIDNEHFLVDLSLTRPRFFRDRFARALGRDTLGDWKLMEADPVLMAEAEKEIGRLLSRFREFSSQYSQ